MKKLFVFTLCLMSYALCFGQSWQWAKHFGSISCNSDGMGAFCLDSSGNSYLTGSFCSQKGVFGNDTITEMGYFADAYIVKVDKNGNFIWAKRQGGNDLSTATVVEGGTGILYDKTSNSIIVCGNFDSNSPNVGSCILGNGSQAFLSKLDSSGNCIWALSEVNPACGESITMDNKGDIYMVGTLGQGGFINTVPVQSLSAGGFIAKIDGATGSCKWAKTITANGGSCGGITFCNNKLYIVGTVVNSTSTIDTATVHCYPNDVFISQFDTSGNVLWVKTMGGPNYDVSTSLSLDGSGNIYVAGIFTDTAYWGSSTLTNGNNKDWFLAKYTNTGNFSWVRQAHISGSFYFSYSFSVSSDTYGNTYNTGVFSGNAVLGTYSITASTPTDLFIAKYDSSGNCMSVLANISNYYKDAHIIAKNNGDFYVAGVFKDSTTFGSYPLTTCTGCTNDFFAKYSSITGISSLDKHSNNQLLIYANPNQGTCNIIVPDDFLHEKNLILNIYDNSGKLIQQKTFEMNDGRVKLDLEEEAKGIYNVILSNKTKSYSGKIVFE